MPKPNEESLLALTERFRNAIEGLHVEGETHNIMIAITKEERNMIVRALECLYNVNRADR